MPKAVPKAAPTLYTARDKALARHRLMLDTNGRLWLHGGAPMLGVTPLTDEQVLAARAHFGNSLQAAIAAVTALGKPRRRTAARGRPG